MICMGMYVQAKDVRLDLYCDTFFVSYLLLFFNQGSVLFALFAPSFLITKHLSLQPTSLESGRATVQVQFQ